MSWKEDLYELDLYESLDLDVIADQSTEAKENDIGMINPISGAGILARENGTLEGFADYGLGFRFSRDSQSLLIFAPNIHVFSLHIEKHDKIIRNTYLKDEYGDIENLLNEIKLVEGDHNHEKL